MNKTIAVRKDEKEMVAGETSSEKANNLKEIIELYKVQNPVKYEQKKEALEAKLKALKG